MRFYLLDCRRGRAGVSRGAAVRCPTSPGCGPCPPPARLGRLLSRVRTSGPKEIIEGVRRLVVVFLSYYNDENCYSLNPINWRSTRSRRSKRRSSRRRRGLWRSARSCRSEWRSARSRRSAMRKNCTNPLDPLVTGLCLLSILFFPTCSPLPLSISACARL